MVALAVAAMPSSRPVKPSRSLVVAFTATREMLRPVISAIRARMMSRNGPIFGRSQISVTSRLAMRPPRAVTRSTAYFRKVGGRAFPLHVAGRKMRADIAIGQRAENGIDQRMQADIAVGMGEKSAGVRHANAADHQMIALAKGMNVVTGAGPDVAEQAARRASSRAKSSGVVSFMFPASPSKVATVNPAHSASAASSVKSLRPSCAARRCASRMASKRNDCGVCAIRRCARSGVASNRRSRRPA